MTSEGIQVPEDSSMKDIEKTDCQYQGILEGDLMKHQEIKVIKEENMKRIKTAPKSKLNVRNMLKILYTCAV